MWLYILNYKNRGIISLKYSYIYPLSVAHCKNTFPIGLRIVFQ